MKLKEFIINKVNKAAAVTLLLGFAVAAQAATWQDRSTYTGETIQKYYKDANTSYVADFASLIQSKVPGIAQSNFYIRWSLYDTSTDSYVALEQYGSTNKFTPSGGWLSYADSYYAFASGNNGNLADLIGSTTLTASTLENRILECWVSDSYDATVNGYPYNFISEPEIDLKIEVIFNEDGMAPDDFVNEKTSTCEDLAKSIIVEEDAATYTIEKPSDWPDDFKATYIRWYLKTADDEVVDISTGSNPQLTGLDGYTTHATRGAYWYSSTATAASGLAMPTVTLADGESLVGYKLVALISGDEGTLNTDGTTLDKEPQYDYTYTFSFEKQWEGTLSDNAIKHSETLLVSSDATKVTIPLNEYYKTILAEYGASSGSELDDDLHIRWYVTKKNSDGTYSKIASSENYLAKINENSTHRTKDGYGLYWNTKTDYNQHGVHTNPLDNVSDGSSDGAKNLFNVTFTKPSNGSWEDYQVVIVLSDDTSDDSGQKTFYEAASSDNNWKTTAYLVHEPNLNMQYTYSFILEGDKLFVHSQGESKRDYEKKSSTVKQYSWNYDTEEIEEADGDIRQGVHTKEYHVYLDPDKDADQILFLPFWDYLKDGGNLEPMAYIRWYDWDTDTNNDRIKAVGLYLEKFTETKTGVDRGYFMLNNQVNGILPTHALVGVTFNGKGIDKTINIACDVSKYYDGMYTGASDDTRGVAFEGKKAPYLQHEPTLSTRYIFHIHPAEDFAKSIKEGQQKFDAAVKATTVDAVESAREEMFNVAENVGRVALSTNAGQATFTVRSGLAHFGYYHIYNDDATELLKGGKMRWYAYLEDEKGVWRLGSADAGYGTYLAEAYIDQHKTTTAIKTSQLAGTYYLLGTTGTTKEVKSVAAGQKYHIVGMICDGSQSVANTIEVPLVHYEMNIIDAPAIKVADLLAEPTYKYRWPEYMKNNMDLKASENFDDLTTFYDEKKTHLNWMTSDLKSQSANHTKQPLDWEIAQYGFCYPSLDNKRIWASDQDLAGMSPLHGDYMILKSMNRPNVSESDKTASPYQYKYKWWQTEKELLDYTYNFGGNSQYGSFFYVDASDETRTVTKFPFRANLCAGSQLCFLTAVADMTGGTSKPEFFASLYAVKKDATTGEETETRIVSFHTGEIDAKKDWYQTYGRVVIPETESIKQAVANADYFELYFDNYALDTDGADYAVDEIYLFSTNSKLEVVQTDGECEDENLRVTVYGPANVIEDVVPALPVDDPAKTIYYKIFQITNSSSASEIKYEEYDDPTIYDNGGKNYGQVDLYKYKLNDDGTLDKSSDEGIKRNANWVNGDGKIGDEGEIYVVLLNDVKCKLEQGKEYFIALTKDLETPDVTKFGSKDAWASPNEPCEIFSKFFIPRTSYLTFLDDEGNEGSTSFNIGCGKKASADIDYSVVYNHPDDDEATGFKTYTGLLYDFFIGEVADVLEGGKYAGLVTSLKAYRWYETNYKENAYTTKLDKTYSGTGAPTAADYELIEKAITDGVLMLSASNELKATIDKSTTFVSIPIDDGTVKGICDYISVKFEVSAGSAAPVLTIGFSDVTYPEDYKRVLRVGLEQLTNMQKSTGGYMLHIPVGSYQDKNQKTESGIYFSSADLVLSATTDPTAEDGIGKTKVATLQPQEGKTRTIVNPDNMYLPLQINSGFTFHEGYEYEMQTNYYDESDDDGSGAKSDDGCEAELYLVIKVVPRYVTWTKKEGKTNTNWNNDENWTRSVKDTLYMTTAQYKDNADIDSKLGQPETFTPMKFTYVTIPTGYGTPTTIAPNLAYLVKSDKEGYKGIYEETKAGDGTSEATENIQYDMCVIYGSDGCKGHKTTGEDVVVEGTTIYDCEKFTGNICKAIYFKPEAELIYQQYLTYDSAWVEKELVPNKWYLMAAPLQDTYAGDMYVPYSTTAGKNGRQETEAFKPITYNTTDYSRTKYPVYQRSWNHDAMVYVVKNDIRNDYSAQLGYSSVEPVEDLQAEWGHTYNDVTVAYNDLHAFSIRAHRKATTNAGAKLPTALLRLPKSDVSFSYFDYTGTSKNPKDATLTVTRTKPYKLVADKDNNADKVEVTVEDLQNNSGYYLVGNPYMASVDMEKFFAANTAIDAKFWTFDGGSVTAEASKGIIRPLQSFFIHSEKAPAAVTFTPAMMTDGNNQTATTGGAKQKRVAGGQAEKTLSLTAVSNGVTSKARVIIDSNANNDYVSSEDVETLFDSNLNDVAIVYTVAGSQTVSVDRRNSMTAIPVGVAGSEADETVNVTLSTSDNTEMYILDAATGDITTVDNGGTFEMKANDYGRYYISMGETAGLKNLSANSIVISVRDKDVTVSAGSDIDYIAAVDMAGITAYKAADCGTSHTFQLNHGAYIINVKSGDAAKTVKIMVK